MELVLLFLTVVLPVLVIGGVIYVAVRLAVRHEHHDHQER
jgi:hypothetical protein